MQFYIELLNELHIEKVHVIAASTGGPSGIYLASHYPERVKTFTLQGAVTKPWKESRKRDALISRFFYSIPMWKNLFGKVCPV